MQNIHQRACRKIGKYLKIYSDIFNSRLLRETTVQRRKFTSSSPKMAPRNSPRNLRVLLDMDGVLADFEGQFLKNFREKYPQDPFVPLEDRSGFYVTKQYYALGQDIGTKAFGIYEEKGFFLSLQPIEGAIEAAREMADMEGVDVYICTSPIKKYTHCVVEKYQWLDKHLGKEWMERMILTRDKTVINGDLLIDDKPNITGGMSPPQWQHVLFTSWHNRDVTLQGGQVRLDGWLPHSGWRDILERKRQEINK
ncbi:PREDICTED: 5'(3')-deoxyribonucleotidase, cytosolic type-like [Branchiostoma belcheri]|uniref:5'(3')-deoxyribonucleotidase, cytosolic type-like n=1 Tax=Branchiostoma belcheri TaxID=7741 RepID=A0A6P4Y8H5_BRABE|nr:PREDICTED: 5'(3')-deoxyribonucleotidase, cytosolic type-like [Branchiostoma belcheri]